LLGYFAGFMGSLFWLCLALVIFHLLRDFAGRFESKTKVIPMVVAMLPSLATKLGDMLLQRASVGNLGTVNGLSLGLSACSWAILLGTIWLFWMIFRRGLLAKGNWSLTGVFLLVVAMLNLAWTLVLLGFGLVPFHSFWY
jgi:hypothetical protein